MKTILSFSFLTLFLVAGISCQLSGQPGLPGSPGTPGNPGAPGTPGNPGKAALQDGTRIRNLVITTIDKLSAPVGFFDVFENVECKFSTLGTALRCIPVTSKETVVMYQDSMCKTAVALLTQVLTSDEKLQSGYFIVRANGLVDGGQVFRKAPNQTLFTTANMLYAYDSSGTCQSRVPLSGIEELYPYPANADVVDLAVGSINYP